MTSHILEDKSVLLVDDEAYTRQVFGKALSNMGAPEVRTAINGADAMDLLSDSAFKVDVIISDFNMPVVHGLQLLKAVRCGIMKIDRATPFAIMTGYSDKRLVDMALALDVNAFLIKPASHKALNKRLSNLLMQTKTDAWLKKAETYSGIDVDGALEEIAKPELTPEQAHLLPLLPSNRPLFRRYDQDSGQKGVPVRGLPKEPKKQIGVAVKGLPDSGGEKTLGVETKWRADAAAEEWVTEKRPHLEGRLCLIDELPEHAIIARDIHTADGRLLMHVGTELSPRIVSILRDLHDLDHPVKEIWIATE